MPFEDPLKNYSTPFLLTVSGCGLVVLYSWRIWSQYKKVHAQYNNLPGMFHLIGNSPICFILPDIPWFNRGPTRVWREKYSVLEKWGSDIGTFYSAWPWPGMSLLIADAAVNKEITTNRALYPKPVHYYASLDIFGSNLITTEGAEWKAHRKIAAPSFTERNNILVVEQAKEVILGLFDLWKDSGETDENGSITLQDARLMTHDLTLQVISRAGFGYHFGWKDEETPPVGHTVTFKQALVTSMTDVAFKAALPGWLLKTFARGRRALTAFNEFEQYMKELIQSRVESPDIDRADLLSNLINASINAAVENGEDPLPKDSELLGNIYLFLLAGHETTARIISFALALLALHQDVQQKVFEEYMSVVGAGKLPTYAQLNQLKYTDAMLTETHRQYPPVGIVPKYNESDTVITTKNHDGSTLSIPVPAYTSLMIHVIATHYNPKYYPDPYKFEPERFLRPYNKDALLTFSAGPRACIGRRFAELEALTVIAILISQYKITMAEGANFVIKEKGGYPAIDAVIEPLTMTPTKLPLTFTKRK